MKLTSYLSELDQFLKELKKNPLLVNEVSVKLGIADNFAVLAAPILHTRKEYREIHPEELFPSKRSFRTHPFDVFHSGLNKVLDFSMLVLKKLARLQTGNIQHYILYAFIFMLIIFFLLYLKIL